MENAIIHVTVDGEVSDVPLSEDAKLTQLQRLVGGYIEPVELGPHLVMFCHEEALLQSNPQRNLGALMVVKALGYQVMQHFYGDVVFAGQLHGETIPLVREDYEMIRDLLGQ